MKTFRDFLKESKMSDLEKALSALDPIELQKLMIVVFDRAKTNYDSKWQAEYFHGSNKNKVKKDNEYLVEMMSKYLPKGTTEEDLLKYFLDGESPEKYFK